MRGRSEAESKSVLGSATEGSTARTEAPASNPPRNHQPISLGELIALLEARPSEHQVRFDFGYCAPTSVMSYRGYYDHLAIGYEDNKHDVTVGGLLEQLRAAVGNVYEGYKGGDFRMNRRTPVWVANYGNSGGTAVLGVHSESEYLTVIATGYCEDWEGGLERAHAVLFRGLGFGNA